MINFCKIIADLDCYLGARIGRPATERKQLAKITMD